jgi:nuclear transport factor 2 (NTF2) superfamily protein
LLYEASIVHLSPIQHLAWPERRPARIIVASVASLWRGRRHFLAGRAGAKSCRPARRARTCANYLPGQEANNIEAQVATMLR